ncbi:MAG: hypothetical protein ACOZF0_16550 [Thermodesulfobacteriota bacterium]
MKPAGNSIFLLLLWCFLAMDPAAAAGETGNQPLVVEKSAEETGHRWLQALKPDFLETEIGGYVGAMTIGGGYVLWGCWDTALMYGFTPSGIGGENIHQLAWKNMIKPVSIRVFDNSRISLYLGCSLIYCFDGDLFTLQPDRYPKGYYPPNQYAFAPYVGCSATWRNIEIYAEFTALKEDLNSWENNQDAVELEDIVKLGIGLKWRFTANSAIFRFP